jgi:hypothetical protein
MMGRIPNLLCIFGTRSNRLVAGVRLEIRDELAGSRASSQL